MLSLTVYKHLGLGLFSCSCRCVDAAVFMPEVGGTALRLVSGLRIRRSAGLGTSPSCTHHPALGRLWWVLLGFLFRWARPGLSSEALAGVWGRAQQLP